MPSTFKTADINIFKQLKTTRNLVQVSEAGSCNFENFHGSLSQKKNYDDNSLDDSDSSIHGYDPSNGVWVTAGKTKKKKKESTPVTNQTIHSRNTRKEDMALAAGTPSSASGETSCDRAKCPGGPTKLCGK